MEPRPYRKQICRVGFHVVPHILVVLINGKHHIKTIQCGVAAIHHKKPPLSFTLTNRAVEGRPSSARQPAQNTPEPESRWPCISTKRAAVCRWHTFSRGACDLLEGVPGAGGSARVGERPLPSQLASRST